MVALGKWGAASRSASGGTHTVRANAAAVTPGAVRGAPGPGLVGGARTVKANAATVGPEGKGEGADKSGCGHKEMPDKSQHTKHK